MLINQKAEGVIQGAVKSRRPAQCEGYTMYVCNDLLCAFSLLINNNELLKNVVKVSMKKKLLISIYFLLIILVFIPVVFNEDPLWFATLLLILNPIALNIVSTLVEKIFIGD